MLHIAIAVHKDKIVIPINTGFTFDAVFLLVLTFQLECLSNALDHGNLTPACFGLRRVDAVVGSELITVIVVDQGVIHADKPILKVNIPPAKAGDLSDSHARVEQDIEDRIPMPIGFILHHELEKQLLLRYSQSFPFLDLMAMRNPKLFQHLGAGIRTNVVVVHCHLKDLMKDIVNAVYSRNLQVMVITEAVVEPFYIGLHHLNDSLLSEGWHEGGCFLWLRERDRVRYSRKMLRMLSKSAWGTPTISVR